MLKAPKRQLNSKGLSAVRLTLCVVSLLATGCSRGVQDDPLMDATSPIPHIGEGQYGMQPGCESCAPPPPCTSPTTWQTEEIAVISSSRKPTAIGVKPNGGIVIAFLDGGSLKVATKPLGGVFGIEILDDMYTNTFRFTLKVDDAGDAHIGYHNGTHLKHAKGSAGNWFLNNVDFVGAPRYMSLALDVGGSVHILTDSAYYYQIPAGWAVDFWGGGVDPDLAIGDDGVVYITSSGLTLTYGEPGNWTQESLGSGGQNGMIALDYTGEVHIGHQRNGQSEVIHTYGYPGGPWVHEAVDGPSDHSVAITIGSSREVHLAYHQSNVLRHGSVRNWAGSGIWSKESIATPGGTYASIAIAEDAALHISHVGGNGKLYHSWICPQD